MKVPPSPHFTALDMAASFNADRARLGGGFALRTGDRPDWSGEAAGASAFRGVPFLLGGRDHPNVVHLVPGADPVRLDFEPRPATWVIFLHAVADRPADLPEGFGAIGPVQEASRADGNRLGDHVSTYTLLHGDGTTSATPILRRFAIQQRHIPWSASPFAAVPAQGPYVFATASEDALRGRPPARIWGQSETRHHSGRAADEAENLWLYALRNPDPARPVAGLLLAPGTEESVVYGAATTTLDEHPLRPRARRFYRLALPDGVAVDRLGEIDTDDRADRIGIDLGTVISARAALDYDHAAWTSRRPDVQPTPSRRVVLVEAAAHPRARIHLRLDSGALLSADLDGDDGAAPFAIRDVGAADRAVRIRILDGGTGRPVPARLHVHGADGQYLPPQGHHRKVNRFWFEDMFGELANGLNQYAYVDGECLVDVPVGTIHVDISRGYEFLPVRTSVEVRPDTEELTFTIDRALSWRERGWVTADTHVHFLSPQTALLEGRAEGVNVVNLLAAQWGEMFSNVADFDGRTTLGARDFGGDGEFLVRVGTENRMQVLGHISLLGYGGPMIHPLSTGGPSEAAIGDRLETSMAAWAEQCLRQGGLVVMPHAPNPQAERAADIVLGLVDAIEMMTFNPRDAQVSPHGLADWYRYQNIGYQLPLVAGSDKMSAASVLGGIRTYARLAGEAFGYDAWMRAVRAGDTFVTVGPLVELSVEGTAPGGKVALPAGGGTVEVRWSVESVSVPVDTVEVIVGGEVADAVSVAGLSGSGSAMVRVAGSTWIAIRVRGSHAGRRGDIAAHTSAVQVEAGGRPVFIEADAFAVLEQIEGAIAYVDTLATRPGDAAFRRIRAALLSAHERLHGRMHRLGVAHRHTPLHRHEDPTEH